MGITNSIELEEAKKTVELLKESANTASNSLNKIDEIIEEKVNSGIGIWDGLTAAEFKNEWREVSRDIPDYINDFYKTINNLSLVIEKMNVVDNAE